MLSTNNNPFVVRSDGRMNSTTLRTLACELQCLHHCDGSAKYTNGETIILASVHGPIAPKQPQSILEITGSSSSNNSSCVMSVIIKSPLSSSNSTNQDPSPLREYEKFLVKQLQSCIVTENYKNCVISITIQIIRSDGSLLSSILQAIMFTLLDASIDLYYIPVAITIAAVVTPTTNTSTLKNDNSNSNNNNNLIKKKKTESILLLDPTTEEEYNAQAVMVFIFSATPVLSLSDTGGDTVTADSLDTTNTTRELQYPLLGCHTITSSALQQHQQTPATTTITQGGGMNNNCTFSLFHQGWMFGQRAVPALHAFIRLVMEQKIQREAETIFWTPTTSTNAMNTTTSTTGSTST